ncbi:MAG TPA: hypothetical protein VN081_02320, partial [Dongiaceae bacterium]|nr:hypothetical protein [Dongiaceae bacterium]
NEYTPVLTELIGATDQYIKDGGEYGKTGQPSFTTNVDANQVRNEKFRIQSAARELGKTARIVGTDMTGATEAGKDESGNMIFEGSAAVTVIVTPRQKARRGKVKEQPAMAPSGAESTADVPAVPAAK